MILIEKNQINLSAIDKTFTHDLSRIKSVMFKQAFRSTSVMYVLIVLFLMIMLMLSGNSITTMFKFFKVCLPILAIIMGIFFLIGYNARSEYYAERFGIGKDFFIRYHDLDQLSFLAKASLARYNNHYPEIVRFHEIDRIVIGKNEIVIHGTQPPFYTKYRNIELLPPKISKWLDENGRIIVPSTIVKYDEFKLFVLDSFKDKIV